MRNWLSTGLLGSTLKLVKKITIVLLGEIILCGSALAGIDNNASVVQLRVSCIESNATINNCFTSLNTLDSWIQEVRASSNSDPLAVQIGPGTFPGVLRCQGNQHISLLGSGSSNTTLKRSGEGEGFLVVLILKDKCNLNVQDLKIDNIGGLAAVQVQDQNSSTFEILSIWNNVEIISTGYPWLEEHCDPAITHSKHFWKASKLTSLDGGIAGFAKAYVSCAENWFHATEITARREIPGGVPQATALLVFGETHVYGGVIRALSGPGVNLPTPSPYTSGAGPQGLVGVYASGPNAHVHIHGTGIDVLSVESNDVAGVLVEKNAHAHIKDSTFNMSSCGGMSTCSATLGRIADFGGMVRSNYQWENGTEPPNISSLEGADTFVETDCSPMGCQTSGSQPHMLIYSKACKGAGGNWFDIVTRSCR